MLIPREIEKLRLHASLHTLPTLWNRGKETTTSTFNSERGERGGTCQALVLSNFKIFLSRRCEKPLIWVRGCSLIRLRFCSLEGLPVQCSPWLLALPSRRFLILHYLLWPSVGDYVLLRTYTAFSAHPLPKESQRSQDSLKS